MNFFWIITLISVFQVVLISVTFLLKKSGNKHSNRVFGLLILMYGILLFGSFSRSTWAWKHFIDLHKLIYPFSMVAFAVGPLSYLYLKSLFLRRYIITNKELLHFLPFAVLLIANIIYVCNHEQFIIWYSPINNYVVYAILMHSLIYLISCLFLFMSEIKAFNSEAGTRNTTQEVYWAKFMVLFFILLWLVKLQSFVILQIFRKISWCAYTESVYYTIFFIFIISIISFCMIRPESIHPKEKYLNSKFSEEELKNYTEKIRFLLEKEKLYEDPDLNLNILGKQLGINTKYLSEIINLSFKRSYSSLINQYRIEASKRILLDNAEVSVKEVCYEVGYNTRSAFNSAFKKYTGLSPSEFQNNIKD